MEEFLYGNMAESLEVQLMKMILLGINTPNLRKRSDENEMDKC